MPELPEVELARATVDQHALNRKIADVDDHDEWECRPHHPGDLRTALVGRRLTAARRRGKSMWCETSGTGRSRTPGPLLGLHLGMSGRIIVTDRRGKPSEGGDRLGRFATAVEQIERKPVWVRFTLVFEDGGKLMLFDKRRLGRVRLDPDLDALGPDAEEVGVAEFRERLSRGTAPVKARLLDQSVIAGVGNLLADETLWRARISPQRRVDTLDRDDLTTLHKALHRATKAAIRHGGVHTGEVIGFRRAGAHCPRCGAEMTRATVGGRTTWWCPQEQR
ncbi:formamidopyrimidine-DNA glycosylase [Friedmanniella endophytica]|uniref:Formamidopyrimidine-DNA glycosylase n=1 Tax=Microlunatus kandeliicorticis TaxID=1759536 RepID=A0A7W3P714_9ACTN|nr:DNA-formamidopyrimidine glycosylase family protein [Microlunatus kandeliicorticis]MBA8795554.1 formamidopyrimidine-DNA glycosylase [Microlunatus kandeliicorticis]